MSRYSYSLTGFVISLLLHAVIIIGLASSFVTQPKASIANAHKVKIDLAYFNIKPIPTKKAQTQTIQNVETIKSENKIKPKTDIQVTKQESTQLESAPPIVPEKATIIKPKPSQITKRKVNKSNKSEKAQQTKKHTNANNRASHATQASSGSAKKTINAYRARVRHAIMRNKYYPSHAQRRRIEGQVIVSFMLYKNGKINHIKIKSSSNNARLDKAAIAAVRNVGKFDPFPASINTIQMEFSVLMDYTLKSS